MPMIERPPGRLLRLLLRAPRWLFRVGLGPLLGHRFVYVVHQGRKSGRLHSTVLETIRYRRKSDEVVVVSGWGEKAHWYRNLVASSASEIRIGRRRHVRPEQRQLSHQETRDLLDEYVHEHPWAARLLETASSWRLRDAADRAHLAEELPALAFTPREEQERPSRG